MELYELNLSQFLEVKLLRLNKPKFNTQYLPLTGSYNSLEDLQKINDVSEGSILENQFREFNLNDFSNVSIDNMFSIFSSFGKVLFCETLEALLVINNTSDKEVVLREFKVRVSNEVLEGYESMFRKTEFVLISLQNPISISANRYFIHKIKLNADIMCKYSIEIDLLYTNFYFNEDYIRNASNKPIKTATSQYYIENNSNVIRKYYKKFLFATNLPFKIKEKFISDNMTRTFLEINLINQSPYSLHIEEFFLIPDSDKNSSSTSGNIMSNNSFITLNNENLSKNFLIESDEEINLVYSFNSYKAALSFSTYVFKVCWRNCFDSSNKYINYVLKNKLNNFNDIFTLTLLAKPEKIFIDEAFTILFQIQNKTNKNLRLKVSKERFSEKDLEIIDIIENEMDLVTTENLTLICKSDQLGTMMLPRIVISDEISKKVHYFDKLLNFNCKHKIELI